MTLISGAWAQDLAQDSAQEQSSTGIAALESFVDQVDSLTADFQQELWSADRQLLETAFGTLSLQRPNRFLWSYRTPIEQLVVADGEHLWMYDVELEQATVTPLTDDAATASPAMLLSGDRAVRDSFDIRDDFVLDGRDWVRLTPKSSNTDFRSVLIGFSGGLPVQLELVDGLDRTTSIQFSEIEVNERLDDSIFEFQPPAGVDVIGDED